jgi:hypothetical protein
MDVLILLLFVSLVLVGGGILLFIKGVVAGDFEHGDRLSLLPLEEDDPDGFDGGSRVAAPGATSDAGPDATVVTADPVPHAAKRCVSLKLHDQGGG